MLPNSKNSMMNLFPTLTVDGIEISDFWRAWQLTSKFKNETQLFEYLLIQENDRWDTIAEQVYGDRQLWWVLVLFNEIEDPFSIYFDKSIPNSITKIKYLNDRALGILLNDIRTKRLQFEK